MVIGLDPLGDGLEVEADRQRDDRVEDLAARLVGAHEGAIHLEDADRQAAHVVDARVARAEVVEREVDAHRADAVERFEAARRADERALGQLEDQRIGRHARVCERRPDRALEVGLVELAARDVDRDPQLGIDLAQRREVGEREREHAAAERHDQTRLLRERDELVGRDPPARRVIPSCERLDRPDPPGRDLDDRLVGRDDLVALDRAAEIIGKLVALAQRREHLSRELRVVPTPGRLRPVHRDVGVAQQVARRRTRICGGDSDARRDHEWTRTDAKRLLKGLQHELCQRHGALRSRGYEDSELVAADARAELVGIRAGDDPARRDLQHLVTGAVAERVDHSLEVVEIDDHQRAIRRDVELRIDTAAQP